MNYCTFEQFQGVWLGSVASVLAHRLNDWEQTKSWLAKRNRIATKVMEMEALGFAVEPNLANSLVLGTGTDRAELILLPAIIFSEGDRQSLTKIIAQNNLQPSSEAKDREDLLIWNCLVNLALRSQFELQDLNLRQVIKQALIRAEARQTTLTQKLETVIEEWERGCSLDRLTEKLLEEENIEQTAIALSCYCFFSTPQEFELGVKRAANLEPQLASLVLALTATLSGAYNGVAGIPRNWRAIANQNPIYQQEQQTAAKLFQAWIGVYSSDNFCLTGKQKIDVVALANTIQPRKALKIISQRSYLS